MAMLEGTGYLLVLAGGLEEPDSRSEDEAEEPGYTWRVWSLSSEADLLRTMTWPCRPAPAILAAAPAS